MISSPVETIPTIARRSVLGGVTAALGLGTAVNVGGAVARTSGQPEPIFVAIERHREAFVRKTIADRIHFNLPTADWAPDYDAEAVARAGAACDAARVICDEAAYALTDVPPTTLGGVLALLSYVAEFNDGGVAPPDVWPGDTRESWASQAFSWPAMEHDEQNVDMFGFALLANVRRALQTIGGVA